MRPGYGVNFRTRPELPRPLGGPARSPVAHIERVPGIHVMPLKSRRDMPRTAGTAYLVQCPALR